MAEWLDEVRARVDAFEKAPKSPEKVEAASRLMVAALDDTPRLLACAEAAEELRLRRALAQIAAADISCQTCLDIKAIAREALGGETDA